MNTPYELFLKTLAVVAGGLSPILLILTLRLLVEFFKGAKEGIIAAREKMNFNCYYPH